MKYVTIGLFVMLLTIALAGAGTIAQIEEREAFQITPPEGSLSALRISNVSGTVTVIGGAETAVDISGEKVGRADTKEEARAAVKEIGIEVAREGSTLVLQSNHPSGDERGYAVNYVVKVPAGWDVTVENSNGQVAIENVRGAVNAHIANGLLRSSGSTGNVRGQVENGRIEGEYNVPAGGNLALHVTQGEIVGKLRMAAGSRCDLATTTGHIDVTLHKAASMKIAAATKLGAVTLHDVTTTALDRHRTDLVGEQVEAVLGAGDGALNAVVDKGAIDIRSE